MLHFVIESKEKMTNNFGHKSFIESSVETTMIHFKLEYLVEPDAISSMGFSNNNLRGQLLGTQVAKHL